MKIKVRIKNMVESSKVQSFLLSNGFERPYNNFVLIDGWLCVDGNSILCVGMSQAGGELDEYEQISFDQLRDIVVLKRNDPKDANVYKVDVPCLYDLYLASDNNLYFFSCGEWWKLSYLNDDDNYRKLLKPIQNNDLPFIGSKESINDKVASAEDARQKHSHYKKDVSHLEFIDVYRVLDLFEVESHAIGHAVKKLLCGGQRGAKDKAQDIQEAIDSLNRELEMMRENENKK